VRAQLERIVASPGFDVPERARGFLRYVVEETLAGRGERIKGYTVAVEVFGRDAAVDANADPVVRIEAGRLRRALERYYLTAGEADPVLIDIPKGGYTPVFARRSPAVPIPISRTPEPTPVVPPTAPRGWGRTAVVLSAGVGAALLLGAGYWTFARVSPQPEPTVAAAAVPDGPTLMIMPFEGLGDGPVAKLYATGLTEEILTQLAPFRELTVLGRETSRSLPAQTDVARLRGLGARYALEGSVRVADERLRVSARLLDTTSAAVLWSQAYDADLHVHDLFAIQADIGRQVATAVAQPYGIVFRADARRTSRQPPDDLEAYACTLRFYAYRAELSPDQHAAVRDCLGQAVARFPDYATAWAMLSVLYLDEDRFAFNPEPSPPAPLERALEAARRAVALDPASGRALQALMLALFFRQEPAESLRVGERALELNPNDTELLGEFGTRLANSGEWARGGALLEQALARNPGHSGYYRGALALVAYMLRDNDRALTEIRQANLQKFPIYQGVAAIIYAELGMRAEATQAGARFVQMSPRFLPNLDAELAKRNFRPEDRARLAEGLRKAGLPVPTNAVTAPVGASSARSPE
jgi:TolB-like protein